MVGDQARHEIRWKAGLQGAQQGYPSPMVPFLAAAPHLGCRVLVWHRRPLVLLRHRQHDLQQQQ